MKPRGVYPEVVDGTGESAISSPARDGGCAMANRVDAVKQSKFSPICSSTRVQKSAEKITAQAEKNI